MEINRREFMKLIGGSFAGLAIGGAAGTLMKIPKSMEPVLYTGPRKESWKLTACANCPGGCSLKVRLIDEFPIQAFGNPLSPVNKGGICSIGLASVASLYHPDRLTGPLKNVDGKFVSITYDEAYKILSDKLGKILSKNNQDNIFIIAQTESQLKASIFKKFSDETGIKNIVLDEFHSNSIYPYSLISDKAPDFIDFEKCDYLLNFGSRMTEISDNPLYFTRKIIEHRAKGYKIGVVQPKLNSSVAKTDDWVPLLPISFADFALGIAYILIKDEKYDKNFVGKYFPEFNEYKQFVLDNYYPEKVEELIGVPADKILSIGRDFEKASAPAAYFDESLLYSTNGTKNAMAIIALNALKGFSGYGTLKDDLLKLESEKNPNSKEDVTFARFKERVADNGSIQALLISGSNIVFNSPNQEELKKQISSIPFVASFSSFIDETSVLANLIIPDHDNFERLDLLPGESMGFPTITVQQPIVTPFFNTTDTSDVFISLMKDLKPDVKLTYQNYSDYLKQIAKQLYTNHTGILMDQRKPTAIENGLKKIGWDSSQFSGFDDFWDGFLEAGGWWNPYAAKESFNPKIEFKQKFSKELFTSGNATTSVSKNKLRMNIFRKNFDYKGNMSIYPVLVEQFGSNWTVFYELWAEINPETAQKLSVNDRSKVLLRTTSGNFPAILIYNPSIIPGNLDIPFGLGHTNFGNNCGYNPLAYSDDLFDRKSGKPSFSETIIEIVSVEKQGESSPLAFNNSTDKTKVGNQDRRTYA